MSRTAADITDCRRRITCMLQLHTEQHYSSPSTLLTTNAWTRIRNPSNVSDRRTERSWRSWRKQRQATESTCCFIDSFEWASPPWSRTQASEVTSTPPTVSWTCSIFCRCYGEQNQMNCFISVQFTRFEDIQRSVSSMQCKRLAANMEPSAAAYLV